MLVPWLEPHIDGHALADRPMFQQDKAPPHTARLRTAFFYNAAVDVPLWPSMSPGGNIIEHVWSHIASKINMMEHMPATTHDLRQCIHAIFRDLPQAYVHNLVWSCWRRVQAVIRQYGGITKYWLYQYYWLCQNSCFPSIVYSCLFLFFCFSIC